MSVVMNDDELRKYIEESKKKNWSANRAFFNLKADNVRIGGSRFYRIWNE